jgi:hypothetical protein
VDDDEEEASLAVVAAGAAAGADEPKVVTSDDVEDVEVEIMDEIDGVPVTSRGAGLRPPAPSSVDPIGIPTRPTGAPADIPVGDAADAVGLAKVVPPPGAHVPDAVPVVPPSKTVEEVVEPMADDVLVVGAPKEASGIEPPNPAQTAMSVVARPAAVAPGDVPCGTSSAAPRGIPVGETGAAAPRPSGDVMPSGEGPGAPPIVLTWATAEPGPRATTSIAAVMNRDISIAPDRSRAEIVARELEPRT